MFVRFRQRKAICRYWECERPDATARDRPLCRNIWIHRRATERLRCTCNRRTEYGRPTGMLEVSVCGSRCKGGKAHVMSLGSLIVNNGRLGRRWFWDQLRERKPSPRISPEQCAKLLADVRRRIPDDRRRSR
jgi:hypothetical protein